MLNLNFLAPYLLLDLFLLASHVCLTCLFPRSQKSPRVTDRERELLRRSSQLDTQVKKLQIQCKNLKSDNDGLVSTGRR